MKEWNEMIYILALFCRRRQSSLHLFKPLDVKINEENMSLY